MTEPSRQGVGLDEEDVVVVCSSGLEKFTLRLVGDWFSGHQPLFVRLVLSPQIRFFNCSVIKEGMEEYS